MPHEVPRTPGRRAHRSAFRVWKFATKWWRCIWKDQRAGEVKRERNQNASNKQYSKSRTRRRGKICLWQSRATECLFFYCQKEWWPKPVGWGKEEKKLRKSTPKLDFVVATASSYNGDRRVKCGRCDWVLMSLHYRRTTWRSTVIITQLPQLWGHVITASDQNG